MTDPEFLPISRYAEKRRRRFTEGCYFEFKQEKPKSTGRHRFVSENATTMERQARENDALLDIKAGDEARQARWAETNYKLVVPAPT